MNKNYISEDAKENLSRLYQVQNTIQLLKQLDKVHGFTEINKEKLARLESEADTLYEGIRGKAEKVNEKP